MRNPGFILVMSIIGLTLLFGCKKENRPSEKKGEFGSKKVLSILPGSNNPRNSEGDFITLNDGRILFVYTHYTGTSSADEAPAYLASRHSDNGGDSWSLESKLVVENEGLQNVMSVSLVRLKNNEIALFYLRKNSLTDLQPMVRYSSDEGKTWSPPQQCITDRTGYIILVNDRVIQLQDGRLIMPIYYRGSCYSYYSDNNGRNWTLGSAVPNPDGVVNQEPGVVEMKNGEIFMFMRTDAPNLYVSYSKDRGLSWSAAKKSNIISATQSPASVGKFPNSGDLLLVWNNNNAANSTEKSNRTPLNMAVSSDNGQTWKLIKTLENYSAGSYCYTAIHFVDKYVLLGYFDWLTKGITIKKIKNEFIYE